MHISSHKPSDKNIHGFRCIFDVQGCIYQILFIYLHLISCGSSSVGRALASQAEGRGFEPRLPLFSYTRKPGEESLCILKIINPANKLKGPLKNASWQL